VVLQKEPLGIITAGFLYCPTSSIKALMEFKAEMQTKESYPLGFIISQSTLLDTAGI